MPLGWSYGEIVEVNHTPPETMRRIGNVGAIAAALLFAPLVQAADGPSQPNATPGEARAPRATEPPSSARTEGTLPPPKALHLYLLGGAELGVLQGEFWTNLRTVAFGPWFALAAEHTALPLRFGVGFDLLRYSSRTHYYASHPVGPGFENATYRQNTSAYLVGLDCFARLQPRFGRFEPFIELVAGVKWFETVSEWRMTSPDFGSMRSGAGKWSEPIAALGYGVGIQIRITPIDTDNDGVAHIHLGYRYLWGADSPYPKPSGERGFVYASSATDLLVPMAGITFRFGGPPVKR
jgi:hypothetical protein